MKPDVTRLGSERYYRMYVYGASAGEGGFQKEPHSTLGTVREGPICGGSLEWRHVGTAVAAAQD
ncbi:uncharacterized protein GLRG_01677 [Colletotrichum graminicola M1.001]|uniref:Uncharacterized protein n=1 Tax=Colletotrichum graminicola (strain M1.001 / M2 / FGSC 10212) TaxID=645133 RepID=E3Q5P2_COLGM|nr:uncharacterized protein GLRG_01677 [Colletotrichum graminicola M1.001]EFQ26533.1 hypothetical protein GLRG_01677 [Colletotrichum graminicola M1.001]